MESKKDSNGYFEYTRRVRSAKLLAREKNLLWLYTSAYDWDLNEPSFYSVELLAAWSGMSVASVDRAKAKLKKLGWIRDHRESRYGKVSVWVTVGIADPDYDKKEFSKFHVYKSKKTKPTIADSDGVDLSELARIQIEGSMNPSEGSSGIKGNNQAA